MGLLGPHLSPLDTPALNHLQRYALHNVQGEARDFSILIVTCILVLNLIIFVTAEAALREGHPRAFPPYLNGPPPPGLLGHDPHRLYGGLSARDVLEWDLEREKRLRDAHEREMRERGLRELEMREKMRHDLDMKPPGTVHVYLCMCLMTSDLDYRSIEHLDYAD